MTPARALAVVAACLAWLTAAALPCAGAYAADATVDLGGHAVPGGAPSTDRADPVVLPPGLWTDTLGEPGSATSTHFYRYDRAMARSTVHVGVIGASQETENTDGLQVVVTAAGEECGNDEAGPGYPVLQGTFGAAVAVGPDEVGDGDSPCLAASSLEIAVSRGAGATGESELTVAVKIVEEAPVNDEAELPEPETVTAAPVPAAAGVEEVAGGDGFDAAPLLGATAEGVTIETTVTEGQERLWRVPLGWGQRLVVTARLPAREADDDVYVPSSTVELHFVGPDRDAFAEEVDDAEASGSYGDEAAELYDSTPVLAYLNRYDDMAAVLPGDYWVSLAVAQQIGSESDPVGVPVEMTFAVEGDPGVGPSYPDAVTGPGGAAGPDGYAPRTPFLVGDGEFAAVASGSPAPRATGDRGDESWGARRWAGVGVGLASIACLAAGLVWLRRGSAQQ